MASKPNIDDVLGDMAMEPIMTPDILRSYLERYPKFGVPMLDFFNELTLTSLEEQIGGEPDKLDYSPAAQERIRTSALADGALSDKRIRSLATQHALPRDLFLGLRKAHIRFGSIPSSVMRAFANAIDVGVADLVKHLIVGSKPIGDVAFKSKSEPVVSPVLDYDAFVASLELSDNEAIALTEFIDTHQDP